ncbi:MAG: hypothetical protein ABSC95_30770 [Acetobacteraceae bacterium]|jgi:hypothetical protein
MQNPIFRSVALLFAVVISAAGFTSGARAQSGGPMDPGSALSRRAQQTPDLTKQPVVPPPALPGAASRADTVAPATRLPTDMSPNEALFDAINRGDIAAARDALSRGAELDSHNLLGMTPMELSVDLGRNDISFLLLSYRGSDSAQGARGQAPAAQTQAKAAKPDVAAKTPGAKSAAREPVVPVKAVVPAAPQTPRLFANDGGSPVPGAGFLGFDAGRSER